MTARAIPSIDQLTLRPGVQVLVSRYGQGAVTEAVRTATAEMRAHLNAGGAAPGGAEIAATIEGRAGALLAATFRPSLRRVINATGVIIHTNLGRAPLGEAALARIRDLAGGYTNLEYDVGAGRRGARDTHAEGLLCRLTGAEAAVVVNNCAAATLLALAALARGREVVVSRAELVEIGGGFRVPDVMAQSGARLREVGTTNRTRVADYALAVSEATGAILRVHPSNFRIEGFVERTPLTELVALGPPLLTAGGRRISAAASRPSARQTLRRWRTSRRFSRASVRVSMSCASAATSCWEGRRPASSSGARRCWRRSGSTRCSGRCASTSSRTPRSKGRWPSTWPAGPTSRCPCCGWPSSGQTRSARGRIASPPRCAPRAGGRTLSMVCRRSAGGARQGAVCRRG